jgi:peptidoglycan hydrolase-like protein with peptidoglycan-binding domain
MLLATLTAAGLCCLLFAAGPHAPMNAPDLAAVTPAQAGTFASPSDENVATSKASPGADTVPLSPEEVLEVQTRLQALQFDPGPIDGVAGPRTTSAIQRFQAGKGQTRSGLLDRELLDDLRSRKR